MGRTLNHGADIERGFSQSGPWTSCTIVTWNSLEMQILRLPPRLAKSEALGGAQQSGYSSALWVTLVGSQVSHPLLCAKWKGKALDGSLSG